MKQSNIEIQENQQLDREKYTEERDEDESDYDSVSSEELYGGAVNKCPRQYAESEVNLFFDALLNNHVFDMGYNTTELDNNRNKYCWCPCSHNMKPWKEQNKLLCAFSESTECQRACGKGKNKNIVQKLKK